jgi:hypothetical protein
VLAQRTPLTAHVLRHTAITAVERIAGFAVAQRFAGHSPNSVTGTYTKADIAEVAKAVAIELRLSSPANPIRSPSEDVPWCGWQRRPIVGEKSIMGRLQLSERRPRVRRRDATSVVPVPGVGGGDAFSSGHANVGERRVTDPVQADAERTDPTKSLAHASEDGVKAPVRETRSVRVVEHSFGTMARQYRVATVANSSSLGTVDSDKDLAIRSNPSRVAGCGRWRGDVVGRASSAASSASQV